MMESAIKVQMGLVLASIAVFIGGFFLWFQAHLYRPQTPEPIPYGHLRAYKLTDVQTGEYQTLRSGKLFFGETAPVAEVKPVFQSRLVLWGITGGKNCRAVVGLDPKSNVQTEIVKPGDKVDGEIIMGIGKNFVVVRNPSGTGKVFLGN